MHNCFLVSCTVGVDRQDSLRIADAAASIRLVGLLVGAAALPGPEELVDFVLDLLHLDGGDGGQLQLADDGEALGGVEFTGRVSEQHVYHQVAEAYFW